jgi:hypothetical protein
VQSIVGQATAAREGLLERFAQWYRDDWAADTTDVAVAVFAESPLAEKIFFERMAPSVKYRATFNRLPQAAREFIGEGRFLSKWQARWSSKPGTPGRGWARMSRWGIGVGDDLAQRLGVQSADDVEGAVARAFLRGSVEGEVRYGGAGQGGGRYL